MIEKKVIMPARLTAENGAKGLLSGEVFITTTQECTACNGTGWEDEEAGEECYECGGACEYTVHVPLNWTAIKAIYNIAVEHLGEPYDS